MSELSKVYNLLADLQAYINGFFDEFRRVSGLSMGRPQIYLGDCKTEVTKGLNKQVTQQVKLKVQIRLVEVFVLADIQDKLDTEIIKWARKNHPSKLKSTINKIVGKSDLVTTQNAGQAEYAWELYREFDLIYDEHIPGNDPVNPPQS